MNPVCRYVQHFAHFVGVEPAVDNETIHTGHQILTQTDRFGAGLFRQIVEEDVISLQYDHDSRIGQPLADFGKRTANQQVAQHQSLRLDLLGQPIGQSGDLLGLPALSPPQHRDREATQLSGIGRMGAAGSQTNQRCPIKCTTNGRWNIFRPGKPLQQVNMDATEEHPLVSHTQCIGTNRRINRLQEAIDALISEFLGQGVVMHATAAVHAGSPRSKKDNPHDNAFPDSVL